MKANESICPVPQDQRPINEYSALKKTFGFSWTVEKDSVYYQTSVKIYFFTLVLFFFIFNTGSTSTLNNCIYSLFGGNIFLSIFYLRIYLAWNYIYTRLVQATVAYEESGWYDGQVWVKTPEVLIKDKLTGQYQVKPILIKVRRALFMFTFFILFTSYFIFFKINIVE
nr:photosystem I assembly protein Ycf36 [Rhodomonas sp. NIES-1730]